jgi:uroporphyrinogen decarboxylase
MRQAGRYLPEYRELRAKSESFMHFCFTPKMASEATIQPIERFGFDAAILFSDILVIPEALGQKVSFEQGEGPRLNPISTARDLAVLHDQIDMSVLNPVFETVGLVKSRLPNNVAFIGFCGAPWTVASYMIAGRGTPDQAPARIFAYRHPDLFSVLIEKLVQSSVDYLEQQVRAGVEVVQIFDSWAGVLPDAEFEKWCLKPVVSMARELKRRCPDVRIIAFSRGAKTRLASFLNEASIDALGLDTSDDVNWMAKNIQTGKPVQGNLDPLILLAGGDALRREAERIVTGFAGGPHIFNLGHGILPTTPIENVELLLNTIRQG